MCLIECKGSIAYKNYYYVLGTGFNITVYLYKEIAQIESVTSLTR